MAFSVFKLTKIFSKTAYANTPEQFLKLSKSCKEQAQKMTAPSVLSTSPKVNSELCKYLADKLKLAIKSAHSFLLNRGLLSLEETADFLDVFKLLHALANVVENFIRNCCQDAWLQAAVLMPNVSEHVLSVGFDLELLTHFFCGSLGSTKVDDVYKSEVATLRQKASHDREMLLREMNALLRTKEKTSKEYQLAALLLGRIETSRQNSVGSFSGAYHADMGSLKEMEQLGKGAFGTVYRAMWLGVEVAKKKFYAPSSPEFEREVSILGGLSHPNVASLLCYGGHERECFMVMELMDGDLFDMMQKIMAEDRTLDYPFSILEAVNIMSQVGRGMEYLHEKRIVHRDLNAMNILVRGVKAREFEAKTKYMMAKLADFGLSKTKERSMTYSNQTLNIGTTRWMAPELMMPNTSDRQGQVLKDTIIAKYPFGSDVYSFAMVCYAILTGKMPYFEVISLNEVKKRVLMGERPKLPTHCPLNLKDLIERCWSQDASKRPRFGEICAELRHLKCLHLVPFAQQIAAGDSTCSFASMDRSKFRDSESLAVQNDVSKPSVSTLGYDSNGEEVLDTISDFPDNDQTPQPSFLRSFDWVIGLDFGTTFSGFAYAKATGPEEISVYYDWPAWTSEQPYCKTLTGLYYKPTAPGNLECASWGHLARSDFMASRRGKANVPQGFYLSNFKLLLKKDLNDPGLSASIPPPLTVHSIIVDYLRNIGELALSVIQSHEGDARFRRDSVQWCVTVPSIWDDHAKQQMKACMVNAGLVSAEAGGIDAVKVVLEPEAASFHCHQILRLEHKEVSLNVKDKILVADVGGGTVDIVVQELMATGRSYKVKELTESSGGLCGGTFVDESFMRFLSKKIPCLDEFLRKDLPFYNTRLLKDLEDRKRSFGHDMESDSDTKEITLHPKLSQKWEEYERLQGLPPRGNYSEIELTQQDMKSIFDPVVDEILELIAAQLIQVPDIKVMFVVGGFAGSPYLIQRIGARFLRDVQHIVCPRNPGSAVCQGAVSLARNPDAIVSRIAKKTYGTSVTLRFDRSIDPSNFLKTGSDGVEWCRNRFDTFVRKGSRVEVNKGVTKEYSPHSPGQTLMMFDLYSSTELDPRYTEGPNVTKEGGFAVTLPRGYSRNDMPVFKFTMYFGRSSIELSAEARFKHGRGGQRAETLELPVKYCQ